jgi:hypothetical protein
MKWLEVEGGKVARLRSRREVALILCLKSYVKQTGWYTPVEIARYMRRSGECCSSKWVRQVFKRLGFPSKKAGTREGGCRFFIVSELLENMCAGSCLSNPRELYLTLAGDALKKPGA